MKRTIYVMLDQVSGQYGGVFDFANDTDMMRAMKNMCTSGQVPEYVIRDTVVVQLAEFQIDGSAPVVKPLMPVVVCRLEDICED